MVETRFGSQYYAGKNLAKQVAHASHCMLSRAFAASDARNNRISREELDRLVYDFDSEIDKCEAELAGSKEVARYYFNLEKEILNRFGYDL